MYSTTDRTLDILKVLMDTDNEHPKNSTRILREINRTGAYKKGGRKSVYSSVRAIKEYFPWIRRSGCPREGWYTEQPYTDSDVLMTADIADRLRCVQAAEKKELRDRIAEYGCPKAREILRKRPSPFTDNFITNAETAFRGIIETAVQRGRRILFYYRAFDPYLKPNRKHNGKRYSVSPYDCYYARETFYLIGADAAERKLKIFRLDRMEDLQVSEERAEPGRKYFRGDPYWEILRMREQMVEQFAGEEVLLELSVHYSPEAMEIVHDLAGRRAKVTGYDEKTNISRIRFRARRGITLTGWLLRNHTFLKVTSPICVVLDVRNAIKELAGEYQV